MREVHYLKLMNIEGIPDKALDFEKNSEEMRRLTEKLNLTLRWYNQIRKTTQDVEFELIATEILKIDILIDKGQKELTWNSEGYDLVI